MAARGPLTGEGDVHHYQGLAETAEGLARGEVSAVALTEAMLARIAALDPELRAFVTVTAGRAIDAARRADAARGRGEVLGPLHGVPLAVKDLFDIEGVQNTAGMPIRTNAVAERTATVIRRLDAAGAVMLGTLQLTEGVFGEYRPPGSMPRNPWRDDLWPGASSGGSAVAVAAGLCFGSIASDTGGSIRMPSSVTGLTGLKPGWGRVSRDGVFELAATLDHIGPMARSARDVALLVDVISGDDPADPTSLALPPTAALAGLDRPVDGLRVGCDPAWLQGVDAEVAACHARLAGDLAAAGVTLVEMDLPDGQGLAATWYDICAAEATLAHRQSFARHGAEYGPALTGLMRHGQSLLAIDLQVAQVRRRNFTARLTRALSGVDALLLPVFPFRAPQLAQVAAMDTATILDLHRFTCPVSLAGLPAATFPAGFDGAGAPIGMQLVGLAFGEEVLLRLVHHYQRGTNHHRARPPAWP